MLRHVIAPERFFTQVSNEILRHPRLSPTAVRLLLWELSRPEGSKKQALSETANDAGIKKTAFIRAKRELKAEGYFHEWKYQVANGKWTTTQMISNTVLTPEEARALRDGVRPAAPSDPKPATGQPTPPLDGHYPTNTEGKTKNPPSQPSHVPAPLIERGGLILASVSHKERRLRLNGRDIQQLAALAGEWLLRGATSKDLREALTDGLPDRIHSPAALARNRLTRKMPGSPLHGPRHRSTAAAHLRGHLRPRLPAGDRRDQMPRLPPGRRPGRACAAPEPEPRPRLPPSPLGLGRPVRRGWPKGLSDGPPCSPPPR